MFENKGNLLKFDEIIKQIKNIIETEKLIFNMKGVGNYLIVLYDTLRKTQGFAIHIHGILGMQNSIAAFICNWDYAESLKQS